jgi:hypothetical protein
VGQAETAERVPPAVTRGHRAGRTRLALNKAEMPGWWGHGSVAAHLSSGAKYPNCHRDALKWLPGAEGRLLPRPRPPRARRWLVGCLPALLLPRGAPRLLPPGVGSFHRPALFLPPAAAEHETARRQRRLPLAFYSWESHPAIGDWCAAWRKRGGGGGGGRPVSLSLRALTPGLWSRTTSPCRADKHDAMGGHC